MNARFLRVKNWAGFQHYKDKEPGWIKLYAKSIRDDRFLELAEAEQWQLVRIWIVASQSSRFVLDEDGRRVPVVVDDEMSLRRAIATVKRIPLVMFIRDGWLIPVDASELLDEDSESSPGLDDVYTESSPGLGSSRAGARTPARAAAQTRGNRDSEFKRSTSGRPLTEPRDDGNGLPIMNELLLTKLNRLVADHADQGTCQVIRSKAQGLPDAALAKVIESVEAQPGIRDRGAYVVAALTSEHNERRSDAA